MCHRVGYYFETAIPQFKRAGNSHFLASFMRLKCLLLFKLRRLVTDYSQINITLIS